MNIYPVSVPQSNFACVASGVRPGSGSERWCAALPVAQQSAATGRQPERDQPAPTDVPGNTYTHVHKTFPAPFP